MRKSNDLPIPQRQPQHRQGSRLLWQGYPAIPMRIPRNAKTKPSLERANQMNTTTRPKGLRPTEYNALLHAIWRLDREIRETTDTEDQKDWREQLERDRQALSDLFVRLS